MKKNIQSSLLHKRRQICADTELTNWIVYNLKKMVIMRRNFIAELGDQELSSITIKEKIIEFF